MAKKQPKWKSEQLWKKKYEQPKTIKGFTGNPQITNAVLSGTWTPNPGTSSGGGGGDGGG